MVSSLLFIFSFCVFLGGIVLISLLKTTKWKLIVGVVAIILVVGLNIASVATKDNFKENNQSEVHQKLKVKANLILGTSETPVYIIDNFLTPRECEGLILSSKGKLTPSPLTKYDPDKHFRDSKTYYFENKNIHKFVDAKVDKFIGIAGNMAEPTQIQKYDTGNQFKAHHDFFHPDTDEYEKFAGDRGQRTWTFTVYLNNVEGGGETEFTKLKEEIKPEIGKAVIWHNLHKSGSPNYETMHRGKPVTAGEKYIITKWFRDRPQ